MEAVLLRDIVEAVGGTVIGEPCDLDQLIKYVDTDSRNVHAGGLFVPLEGEHFDGHSFINDALERGAAGCFTARERETYLPGKFYIKVRSPRRALRDLAKFYKSKFSIPFIAITGSVGKTTAKDMVLMAKAALEYSAFETIVGLYIYNVPATNMNEERNIVNSNYVINPYRTTYSNKNVKGIKTGTTDAAGRCLISYASKDGYNYMAVAMGGGQLDSDADGVEENQAFMDTNHMYKWAFKNLKYEIVTQQGQFVCSVPLEYCADSESAKLVAKSEVLALVPQGNDSESVSFRPVDVPESLAAPLKTGDAVGKAEILFAGQVIATVDLVVAEDASYDLFLYIKSVIVNSKTFITLIIVVIVLLVGGYITLFVISNNKRKKQREIKMVKYNELRRNTRKKNK